MKKDDANDAILLSFGLKGSLMVDLSGTSLEIATVDAINSAPP